MATTSATKRCARCGDLKPLGQFQRNRAAAGGRNPYCHPCETEYMREWRRRDGDAQQRARARNRAVHRAFTRLKHAHPDDFERLLAAELNREGLS